MPRPKRSHEEVVEEARLKEEEAAAVREKQQAAVARVAAIEQGSGEHEGVVRSRSQRLAGAASAVSTGGTDKRGEITHPGNEPTAAGGKSLILRLRLPRRGVEGGAPTDMQSSAEAEALMTPPHGDGNEEPTMLDEDEEAPVDEHDSEVSGDEYQPQAELEMDDDNEVEIVTEVRAKARGKKVAKKTKNWEGVLEANNSSMAIGIPSRAATQSRSTSVSSSHQENL
ncbi:hypothetical protein C2E23DRAFT_856478 [Lenzites betulinus]|nr:hypothetical protein C2E23DRAFT_856478 [Lenzites betulinus]